MTGKERVIRTIEFNNPDRIPMDIWLLPATQFRYGRTLEEILNNTNLDIFGIDGPTDMAFGKEQYELGEYTDVWGCTFTNIKRGVIGQVKHPMLDDWGKLKDFRPPVKVLEEYDWSRISSEIDKNKDKFVLGGWINVFERMQFMRGTENLYMDLALKDKNLFKLIDMLIEYYEEYLTYWLKLNVDGIRFADDWGAQRGLLISPNLWRQVFKPIYRRLMNIVLGNGKYVFFHSDGFIMDIYEDFIDLGVKAINSQVWCMGVDNIAKRFAGRITFWGEISRQNILPHGSTEDINNAKREMRDKLFVNGGGLIGQSEIGPDVPIENIRELVKQWD